MTCRTSTPGAISTVGGRSLRLARRRDETRMATSPVAAAAGASSGIGAATARRLASSGFHVVAVARRADRIEALVKELGSATAVAGDVTSDTDVAALARTVEALPGPLEVLVTTAGGALVAEDVADIITFCVTRPHHVNVDRLVLRPLAQAAQHKVHRVL